MVFMPHWPTLLGEKPINYGLERIEALMEKLGNPQLKLPPVVHVAGTNGKGSTLAFLQAILEAAGYRVHRYTSPHLLQFNERIVLAGKPISDDYLHEIMEECRAVADGIPVTFFEGTTAGAFLAFSKVEADIVLLETGLGGRLDATNIIPSPVLTILTPIAMDHMEYLGPTLELIAGEKVGIMKQDCPCVVSLQSEEVIQVIERKAEEKNSKTISLGYDFDIEPLEDESFMYHQKEGESKHFPVPGLAGAHQYVNAATAITSALALKQFKIDDKHIAKGLQNVQWPARLQRLRAGNLASLLPAKWQLWLDGAHNDAAAHVLACTLEDWQQQQPMKTYVILGMTRGRDVARFLSFMKNHITYVAGILVETEPSAIKAEAVAQAAQSIGIESEAHDSLEDAIIAITELHQGLEPARILITGSLYLSSDALKANK